jgi:membrane protein DedA with SNARE-associated domain
MEQWIMPLIERFGYFGTFFLIFIENIFPPIPSEVILTFGGFTTTTTNLTIAGMVIASTAGSMAGAGLLYWIGSYFSIERLESIVIRWGKYLSLKVDDLHRADRWFAKQGPKAVFICRMVPLLRSLISIPAGMSRMKLNQFLMLTLTGTLIWNFILISLGAMVGNSWELIVHYLSYYSRFTYLVLGLVAVGVLIYLIKKNKA